LALFAALRVTRPTSQEIQELSRAGPRTARQSHASLASECPRVVATVQLRYHEACTRGFQSPACHQSDIHSRVNPASIANFERLLAAGRDDALLRFGLGSEYLKVDAPSVAATHFAHAVAHDPGFSAAWKLYGRALTECGRFDEALAAYERGIAVAELKGDKQAAKEMAVFAKRIIKRHGQTT
jgi:predicted Zn-dependent protease